MYSNKEFSFLFVCIIVPLLVIVLNRVCGNRVYQFPTIASSHGLVSLTLIMSHSHLFKAHFHEVMATESLPFARMPQ